MTSHVVQLFKELKCSAHPQGIVAQVCVSSQCTQSNRVCCMQCGDQLHMGPEHILISHIKFSKLLQEFHAVLKEKQSLNQELVSGLRKHQSQVNSNVDRYYKYIQDSLVKENELTSYEELENIDVKTVQSEEIKKRINQIVDDHSWMLEMNCKTKSRQYIPTENHAIETLRSKYTKLQKRLTQINETCEYEIRQVLEKRSTEVKKLFHLFDQVKYDLEDDGKKIEQVTYSMNKLNIEESPLKQERPDDSEKKKVKEVFDFLSNMTGSE